MKRQWFLYAVVAIVMGVTSSAHAQRERDNRQEQSGRSRAGGSPLLAVVSLGDQRVTIYGADGKIMHSPVSTGATGYETPAGIFSIVQKKEDHYSNLYEDGNMPFMQRITWTGIALHAGALPGYPASHGCIRLPSQFASRLFGETELGMRVVVMPEDIAPVEIHHPLLFQPQPQTRTHSAALVDRSRSDDHTRAAVDPHGNLPRPGSPRNLETLKSIAAVKAAEAETAGRRAKQLRLIAARKVAEAAPAAQAVRAAEAAQLRAEGLQKEAERLLETAASEEARTKADEAKARALAKIAEAAAQLEAAQAQARAKKDAAVRAEEEAQAAEVERSSAQEAAEAASRRTSPVSVFISRKMQRLYIRHANEPLFEGPVTIRDPDKPIGTFVFTSLTYANASDEVRWSVISMYKNPMSPEPSGTGQRKSSARNVAAIATDVSASKAALDRISMPQEVIDRIVDVLPGSSLIISDEAASIETGKDTDFVVVMSGEPQGALKIRSREPIAQSTDPFGQPRREGPGRRSPYASEFQFPFLWK